MYRLYRKMTKKDHFSMYSVHFCLDITRLFNLDDFCFGPQQQCYKEVLV